MEDRKSAFSAFMLFCTTLTAGIGVISASRSSAGPKLVDAGRSAFTTCAGCHAVTPGHGSYGPNLFGVVGRQAGTAAGSHPSPALKRSGRIWTPVNLDAFLAAPAKFIPGNRMPFPGVSDPKRRKAIIAYLQSLK